MDAEQDGTTPGLTDRTFERKDDVSHSETSRPKVPTEKMKEYRRQLMERDFDAARRACNKQVNTINSLLTDKPGIAQLQKERGKLEARIDDLESAHIAIYDTLEVEDERIEQNSRYDTINHKNRETLRLLNENIAALQLKEDDRSSIYSGKSKRSRTSRRSKQSSASSSLSLERRAEMAAKAARLEAELKFHDVESKKNASLKKQEDEIKKLLMEKELAATQAELKAVNKLEEELNGEFKFLNEEILPEDNCSQDHVEKYLRSLPSGSPPLAPTSAPSSDAKAHTSATFSSGAGVPKVQASTTVLEPPRPIQSSSPFITNAISPHELPRKPDPDVSLNHAASDVSIARVSPGEDLIQKLADLLSQRQDRDSLPRPEPEIFTGNPLRYPNWVKSFETFIERKTKISSERLYYLSKYTTGEAKESISGLLALDNVDAYSKAKKILMNRFGNPFIVADAYRKRIDSWPKIQPTDGQGLRKFADFLQHCNTAMNTIQYLDVLNDPDENQRMIKKLPSHVVVRWSRVVDEWLAADELEEGSEPSRTWKRTTKAGYPPFEEFCKFLEKEARISCNPVTSLQALKSEDTKDKVNPGRTRYTARDKGNFDLRAFATGSSEEKRDAVKESSPSTSISRRIVCPFCKDNHELDLCMKFTRMPLSDKRKFAQANALCWGCLKWGHMYKECRGRKTCRTCNRRHPTSLHDDSVMHQDTPPDQETRESGLRNPICHRSEVRRTDSHAEFVSHSLIVPVWLHHESNPDNKIMVYALLDDQSDACFVRSSALEKLDVNGPEVHLKLSTVLAEEDIISQKITGLVARGVNESTDIRLPQTYTRDIIPAKRSQIPRPETARKWPHLKRIADNIMPYEENVDVALLLGINCARAIKPREIIPGNDDDPYAKRTALGWGVIGMVAPDTCESDESLGVNRTVTREVQFSPRKMCHFVLKTHVKEILNPAQVNRMFELDFGETKTEVHPLSYEDRSFMSKVSKGIHQRRDGHYEMPLPFKQEPITLPDNKGVALNRLIKLKRRLKTDSKYRNDYLSFMNDLIARGHAEKVPPEEKAMKNGQVWYIPHHGVYHPQKPGKIRVVFDCSVEFAGESLNRHLLQGPDQTNNLVGVLCRFRQEPIALMCDIEGMFHQVHVNPEHRNFLRFLWWENGRIDTEPTEYRMTVHLFGATSSPGCANYALKRAASDYEDQCGSEAGDFVKKNFYVDDGLKSVPTPEAAISLVKNTKKLCKKGGFNLHKFVSNNMSVIEAIPNEDRSKDLQNLNITKDTLPIERALGVQWCIESDTFQFRVQLKDQPLTRRGILSTVSSVFDPLGMLAPLILVGKSILQELCRDGAGWDDSVPEPLRARWERWRGDLHLLSNLKIPRCYKPEGFGELNSVELHHFSDASKDAYGQCSYLRLTNDSGQTHCSLAMAKSRVAPLKPVTIPRLELTAALVSVKTSDVLRRELEYDQITEVFWTDSKVVIGYVSNDARRFHTFVANRVQQIRDRTTPNQWRYVETDHNPADDASRGLYAQNLIDNSRWWNGPDFLWKPLDKQSITDNAEPTYISPEDPEVKKISAMTTQSQERFSLPDRLKYFSSWHKAKRAVAACLRLQKKYHSCPKLKASEKDRYVPVNTQELQEAETVIVKSVQEEEFQNEISLLHRISTQDPQDHASLKTQKKSSTLYKMDPFLDSVGVLRVGGRLKHADLSIAEKHPIVLPKKGHVTNLIISHFHDSVLHQGRGMTHSCIRSSGFWIIGGSSVISDFISKCVSCRRLRGAPQEQKMANLPEDRVQPAPPFSYCAVDYFGPFYVKEGRRQVKRYGVLFTCLSSRAVHLEVANSLTADSFINAYRRFVGRRGPVRQIRSDQGTNFVGAQNELQQALSELDHEKVRQELLKRNCDWVSYKMNVPHASHMGGVWERQIRTVRNILATLLSHHGSQLDDESLSTFLIEAEAIVNCRPLTVNELSSPEYPNPLTPSQLLTMKSSVILPPPGSFQRADLYSKKRWRRVQYLANEFWVKWKADYLQSLQPRQKWVRTRRNMAVDDVVIVKDDNLPRNRWQLARVFKTYESDDGLVRKVKVVVADPSIDKHGRRSKAPVFLERPVQKLVLLMPCSEALTEDRGVPTEEP